jgi:large subunit ribosomal protein L7/L12
MYSDERDRLLRLERKVDFLFRRLGIDPGEALAQDDRFGGWAPESALPSSFHEALGRGKKIQAIKIYREVTGVGLKDAKRAVEAMVREQGA